MTAESSIDPAREVEARDVARRKWLAEDVAHRQAAMAEFILATVQAAATLQRCLEIARALGWSRPASPAADSTARIIEQEFRKQFGRELFE